MEASEPISGWLVFGVPLPASHPCSASNLAWESPSSLCARTKKNRTKPSASNPHVTLAGRGAAVCTFGAAAEPAVPLAPLFSNGWGRTQPELTEP